MNGASREFNCDGAEMAYNSAKPAAALGSGALAGESDDGWLGPR